MFAAQATAMKYMGLLLSPMPRKMLLMMLYAVINGMPIKHTVRYRAVPSTASAGVDITETMGSTSSTSAAVSTTETSMNSVTVFPTQADMRFLSPAPTARPIDTVVPIASPTIMTVSMCMTWLPTETAVVDATPSYWPIINKSASP